MIEIIWNVPSILGAGQSKSNCFIKKYLRHFCHFLDPCIETHQISFDINIFGKKYLFAFWYTIAIYNHWQTIYIFVIIFGLVTLKNLVIWNLLASIHKLCQIFTIMCGITELPISYHINITHCKFKFVLNKV